MSLYFDVYVPGYNKPESADALANALADLDQGKPYADMMRLRASGGAADECLDVYYLCRDGQGRLVSRLWMGWGRHDGAVGNWGNFFTEPDFRGQGIGSEILLKCMDESPNPLYLYVFSGNIRAISFYEKFGFSLREAVGKTRLILERKG